MQEYTTYLSKPRGDLIRGIEVLNLKEY